MTTPELHDYLVLSRGRWDPALPPERIQAAIDAFYAWYERLLAEGRALRGHRLATPCRLVSRDGVLDGPFTEAKEVVGGYWFFRAASLEEAVALAAQNPCVACGLSLEVRPLEHERASAYAQTNETPR
ncbi:MAG: hypothetical protein KIT17_05375 [Rubrivivax sp.]|nr:hypothetical protein [Rubrivivax sp.]